MLWVSYSEHLMRLMRSLISLVNDNHVDNTLRKFWCLGAIHSFDFHFYLFTAVTHIKCNNSKYNSTCRLGTVSINCEHTI